MRTRQNVNFYFLKNQIKKEIFEKNKENRNFSLGNQERAFGKEIKNVEFKKMATKNAINDKFSILKVKSF